MIKVTVEGPGGCIEYEMIVIRPALEKAGLTVTVIDDCPLESENEDAHVQSVEKLFKEKPCHMLGGVTLVAVHFPWGG